MFEKVNPSHPDKIADRIAGSIVDQAYMEEDNPRIAVEVLIGHGHCHIIAESSVKLNPNLVKFNVWRISETRCEVDYQEVPQDKHLADNQKGELRCGDNGIFMGRPVTDLEKELSDIVHRWYRIYPTDGKFILCKERFSPEEEGKLIACQSNIPKNAERFPTGNNQLILNPLGDWTGGIDVDTGATNRKLGSDMGRAVTGGGLHGKDLSKADVSVNIVCHLLAEEFHCPVYAHCAIGDKMVAFHILRDARSEKIIDIPYYSIVDRARLFIGEQGGFEKFAEWGLI